MPTSIKRIRRGKNSLQPNIALQGYKHWLTMVTLLKYEDKLLCQQMIPIS